VICRAAKIPSTSRRAAVNSDAVPKDLDRIIDAALDRCADILWDDARQQLFKWRARGFDV
jgi:hypothetical protein